MSQINNRNRRSLWVFVVLVLMAGGQALAAPKVDKSDLNGDGVVDQQDVDILASNLPETDWQNIDACNFYQSSVLNPKYFRRIVRDDVGYYTELLDYMAAVEGCATVQAAKTDKSDLNSDGVVDLADLALFSTNYLNRNWETVDWCVFHGAVLAGADFEGEPTDYYAKHFKALLAFINEYFNCGGEPPPPDNLALENTPTFVTRVADGTATAGGFYVSDPRLGSVFIYDPLMTPTGELKNLNKPLGVAVSPAGQILVGNDGRDNIEVYNSTTGELLSVIGQGLVKMPTALTFDIAGNLYVTDSAQHRVQVFDSMYNPVLTIGKPGMGDETLKFPIDAEIIGQEIFVADQGHARVQVYSLNGEWLRSITFEGTPGQNCNWFTGVCEIPGMPPFTRLQALASDSLGRLHVLDSFAASVIIFDPADGSMVGAYGEYGTGAGQLRVPMDVSISGGDVAVVTTGDGDRIEIFTTQ